MRRRLVISTIVIVVVILVALAIPVRLIMRRTIQNQFETQLNYTADCIVDMVDAYTAGSGQLEGALTGEIETLIFGVQPEYRVIVLDPNGKELFTVGDGNANHKKATRITSDGSTIIVWAGDTKLNNDFRERLIIMIVLLIGAVFAATILALLQGRQLIRPLERLAGRASRIGDGDFSSSDPLNSGIPEIDRIATALDQAATRVDTLLANERHFTADATHQLRTGLAGLAMRAEILSMHSDREVADEGMVLLDQTDQLNQTIDELLALARDRLSQERAAFDLHPLVLEHANIWRIRFQRKQRRISIVMLTPPPTVVGTKGLVGQILDILIHNSLVHGQGMTSILIDGPSLTVIDQGEGISESAAQEIFDGPVDPAARHGRGLSLARRLAQVDGGSITIDRNRPLAIHYQLMRADAVAHSG